MDYELEYSGLLSDDGGYVTLIEDGGLPLATYEFDGEGRRERVTHDGIERRYVIVPALAVGLESVHAVLDDEGELVASYVYEGEHALMRIDADGDITYYLRDSMGTVVGLTDETATSTATFRYDAFGNPEVATGSAAALPAATLGDFRFQGMWLDPAGFYFVRARTYDGSQGRLLTRDPYAGVPSRSETLPAYLFTNGNPLVFVDPTGRLATEQMVVLTIQESLALVAFAYGASVCLLAQTTLANVGVDFSCFGTNEPLDESCATKYPEIPLCSSLPSEYKFKSVDHALRELKRRTGNPNLRLHNRSVTREGPCVGSGTHYNVRDGKRRAGSIASCPCCVESESGPIQTQRCRLFE
jgi:RHS repeat-associated protein